MKNIGFYDYLVLFRNFIFSIWYGKREKISNPFIVEYNVQIGRLDKDDCFALFGSYFTVIAEQNTKYATLFRNLGIFKSISEAQGAGWNKDIPEGWSIVEVKRGYKKHVVYIMKNYNDLEERQS